MRISPFLIGVTLTIFAACQRQNPSENFQQPVALSGALSTGDIIDSPNEISPKTADSLEVSKITAPIEIHATSGSIIMGDLNAPVTLTIFDDYDCFYCREFGTTDLSWVSKTYVAQKKLNIERVLAPKSLAGTLMAKVALCSAQQHQFEATDKALHSFPLSTDAQVAALAKTLKLNLKTLQSCIASPSIQTTLQTAVDRAKVADVSRFPSFILKNDHWIGVLTRDELQKKIENAR